MTGSDLSDFLNDKFPVHFEHSVHHSFNLWIMMLKSAQFAFYDLCQNKKNLERQRNVKQVLTIILMKFSSSMPKTSQVLFNKVTPVNQKYTTAKSNDQLVVQLDEKIKTLMLFLSVYFVKINVKLKKKIKKKEQFDCLLTSLTAFNLVKLYKFIKRSHKKKKYLYQITKKLSLTKIFAIKNK